MKKIYLLFFFKIILTVASAQEINPCPISICNVDFRQTFFSTVRKHNGSIFYGKSNFTYSDAQYKNEGNGYTRSQTGNVICESDWSNTLVYDVYYPDFSNYNTCSLPFIIFVHGGGFSDCAGIDADGLVTIATEFAKRGFVYFLVNYRSGVQINSISPLTISTIQQMEAVYRAAQDVRGAIRSIIKRQLNETTGDNWQDTFRIDTSKMFLGGNSAGKR